MKTKEEILNDLSIDHNNRVITIEEMLNRAYSVGFEAFREKVEEGVKKWKDTEGYMDADWNACINQVLTTIREIKE